jgi:hypothetical protein
MLAISQDSLEPSENYPRHSNTFLALQTRQNAGGELAALWLSSSRLAVNLASQLDANLRQADLLGVPDNKLHGLHRLSLIAVAGNVGQEILWHPSAKLFS